MQEACRDRDRCEQLALRGIHVPQSTLARKAVQYEQAAAHALQEGTSVDEARDVASVAVFPRCKTKSQLDRIRYLPPHLPTP